MKHFDLERPIIEFSNEKENTCITLKDMCGHVFVTGSTGSGKSSGSMNYIILKMLLNGCGGLVLSVKSEVEIWRQYCVDTGRTNDLIEVGVDNKHSFDFLAYESAREASTNFITNLTALLSTVLAANKDKQGHAESDPFWSLSQSLLLHNCIAISMIANSKVTIPMLYDIALSVTNTSPDSAFEKTLAAAKKKVQEKIDLWEWRQGQDCISNMSDSEYNSELFKYVPETRQLRLADQFFIDNFRKLSEKTRSIIELSLIGFLFNLLQEPVYSIFCDDSKPSNFTPESCLDGKIILLDLPTQQHGDAARFAQIIFKEIFMKAMLRRDVKANNRVCFLVSDECQEMLTESDSSFLATARASLISVIYATQSLPSLYAKMGGSRSEHRVKYLIGNFNYKILHCNSDVETNSWASNLIGKAYQKSESETITTTNGEVTTSQTVSVELAEMVRESEFSALRTGGPQNDFRVTAYLHAQGKKFASGFSHKKITFTQNFKPL